MHNREKDQLAAATTEEIVAILGCGAQGLIDESTPAELSDAELQGISGGLFKSVFIGSCSRGCNSGVSCGDVCRGWQRARDIARERRADNKYQIVDLDIGDAPTTQKG